MLTAILALVLSALVSYSVYFRWTRRKFFAAIGKMQSPPSLPVIGSGYKFVGQTSPEQMHKVMTTLTGSCESPTPIWSGQNLILMVHKPEHVQAVLKSEDCLDRAYFNRYFQLDHGMLTTSVASWKAVRKLLNMSLSPSMINSYIPTVNRKSRIMVEQVSKLVGQPEQNLYHEIAKWALDMICATVLGLDINVQREGTGVPYLKVVDEYLTLVTKRVSMGMTTGDNFPNFIYNLTQEGKSFLKAAYQFRTVSNIIMDRKVPFKQAEKDDFAANPRKPRLLLDMIYHIAEVDPAHMNTDSIAEHLDEIIFAGQDAMADVISKIILMLAMHPELQERVHQEIISVSPDQNSELSHEDCSKLTYTEMFCKETLRLFPAASFIGRRADADVKLDDRHTVPKGAEVFVAFFKMHRDPAIWGPRADHFDPDNFMPERVAQRHPYAFLPFSAGSRNCLGFKFAWYPVKIILAHLVRSYRFRTTLRMEDLVLQNWCIIILKIAQGSKEDCASHVEGTANEDLCIKSHAILPVRMQKVPYLKVVDEYLTLVTKRVSMGMTTGDNFPNFIYNLTQEGKSFLKAAYQFRTVSNIIMDRKVPFKQAEKDDFAANPRKPRLLLDMIYHIAEVDPAHMNTDSIAEHLDEIIFAGQDAMADVISKIILMLAMHPELQERVHQEIISVSPDQNSELSHEDCSKLTYTEMFCKETLRLFPAASFIGRRADADVKLDDRHTVPKGAEVFVAFFKMHRDPAIWGPRADHFDPDNFMPERVAQRHPYAFLPFSAGSRNCLGFKFAWYPVKIILAHLVRSYRFRTTLRMEDLVLQNWCIIILKIAQGSKVSLERRDVK